MVNSSNENKHRSNNRYIRKPSIKASFTVNLVPDHTSQLINDSGFITREDLLTLKKQNTDYTVRSTTSDTNTNITELLLQQAKEQFEQAVDMDVKYKNGLYYKPRYASENYGPLLVANKIIELETQRQKSLFPKEIWDATKVNSVVMTAAELQELTLYLAEIYEVQFQQYKKQCKAILEGNKHGI